MAELDLHALGVEAFDSRVRQVRDDQWDVPTPCSDWTVRDLVAHLVDEQLWVPGLVAGRPLAEVGDEVPDDVLGDDPRGAWASAVPAARAAWTAPGSLERTVDLSVGPTPAPVYLAQMTMDLAVHAWDLARGLGVDDRLDPDLVAGVREIVEDQRDEFEGSGLFADPVPVPDDADPQDRLLADLGRHPGWTPPG